VLDAISQVDRALILDFERDRESHLQAALSSPEVVGSLARELKGQLSENLNQSHDFLQLSALIRGYASALLEEKHPGVDVVTAAESSPVEGAIYFATELMRGKLDATLYLNEPNRAFGGERKFELHKMITKYYRIYRWQAEQKHLNLTLEGRCFATVQYRPEAIGAVVQALLDNLVKYSPAGGVAEVVFEERDDRVDVSFASLGPEVRADEAPLIFMPGYRSDAARRLEPTGLGFGLAAARQISDMLDLNLTMTQDPTPSPDDSNRHLTQFMITLLKAAAGSGTS